MLEIGLPRSGMTWSFLQDLSRRKSYFPGAQLQEITFSTFFSIQLGYKIIPDRIWKNVFVDPIEIL